MSIFNKNSLLILTVAMTFSGGATYAEEEGVFSLTPGLAEYYLKQEQIEIFASKKGCSPGVSQQVVGVDGVSPCPGGGDIPPDTTPCISGKCGPGVGLEGGLGILGPEVWDVQVLQGN